MWELLIPAIGKVLEKVLPDPQAQAEAKLKLAQMVQDGELESAKIQMSAILAEAQSADPWTSRARPSFMYVMYVMILFGIPMGILSLYSPVSATQIAAGMQAWLHAIPDGMWATFGIGYSGYAIARSMDKKNGAK